MSCENKELCRVRTITAFLILEKNRKLWKEALSRATRFCNDMANKLGDNGYVVQSIRIVTNPFGEYLDTSSISAAKANLAFISDLLDASDESGLRIRFAVGEACTETEIFLLPELIQAYGDLCNACVNVDPDAFGVLDNGRIDCAAQAVAEISRLTPRGEGNFNFTVNFNCPPLIPYFPAGYHQKDLGDTFVIGLETPDLLVRVLEEYNRYNSPRNHNEAFRGYYESLHAALQYHVSNILSLIETPVGKKDFSFAGLDSSAAPSKNCASMVDVYKQMGIDRFGASGTVEASSLLTRVFQSIEGADLVGFSGLMLAVTEDRGLAEGTRNGDFDIRSLLTYSAVCGIGLDTVPIPGDTATQKIAALMRDTGTLAYRLDKPLTVRLFPVPGLQAGDKTAFESDDLCNCTVLAVP